MHSSLGDDDQGRKEMIVQIQIILLLLIGFRAQIEYDETAKKWAQEVEDKQRRSKYSVQQ